MENLGMRNLALYPSTCAPAEHFIVMAIDPLTGVSQLVHTFPLISFAIDSADVKNYRRKDSLDPFFIAYDETGEVIHDFRIIGPHPKQHPGIIFYY